MTAILPPLNSDFSLSGRVAFITGAASGIGRALAIGLAEAGADVVVTDLHESRVDAEETAHLVSSYSRKALVLSMDVTFNDSIDQCSAKAVEVLGKVDLLINNASIAVRITAFELSVDEWNRVIAVNLRSVFFCSQSIGRLMAQQKTGGRIVNISSIMGRLGIRNRSCYCASKAGV